MAAYSPRDIRDRALRAAAGVALFTGGLSSGCGGTEPVTDLEAQAEPVEEATPTEPPPVQAVERHHIEAVEALSICDPSEGGDAWLECCQEIGWDWTRGCAAWGPPAPPEAA